MLGTVRAPPVTAQGGGIAIGDDSEGAVGKTALFGAEERGGNVASKAVPVTDASTLDGFAEETVELGSTVYPDGPSSYGKLWEYIHDTANRRTTARPVRARFTLMTSRGVGPCSITATMASDSG